MHWAVFLIIYVVIFCKRPVTTTVPFMVKLFLAFSQCTDVGQVTEVGP
jgi:hypothetical protein